jgi:hypothetical protein
MGGRVLGRGAGPGHCARSVRILTMRTDLDGSGLPIVLGCNLHHWRWFAWMRYDERLRGETS